MLQEIALNDNGFHNNVNGMNYDEFKIWLLNEYEVDNGKLEDWMVPQSSYWLFDDATPVGYGRIRHYLNDALAETGGHIRLCHCQITTRKRLRKRYFSTA